MSDSTELFRRIEIAVINNEIESTDEQKERARLEEKYGVGNVWDTDEVSKAFEITGFLAPYCCAIRRSDGEKGALAFQHNPRFYFDFK